MKKEQSRPATKEDLKSFFRNTKQELLKEYDDFLEKSLIRMNMMSFLQEREKLWLSML